MSLDQRAVNTIRILSAEAIQKANSGHPGLPLGAAPMAYTLWTRHMKHNPADPSWPDRDRFILSGGHGSALLYSLLHLAGYGLTIDDLKSFRQWGSRTPGHPEYGLTPGVETTTGPLGQGFATAVGMAIAEANLAARYNTSDAPIVDHFTYVLATDGDMMEGVACEAASLAGHLKLGKLICLYDCNDISLAGGSGLSFTEDVAARFAAYGWHVITVADGNDLEAIDNAIAEGRSDAARPTLIVVRTIIGYGSPAKAGSHESHGSPLGETELAATKANLGFDPEEWFVVPAEVAEHFAAVAENGKAAQASWEALHDQWVAANPAEAAELAGALAGALPEGWDAAIPAFGPADAMATRASGGKVLTAIASRYPALMGGSADLNPSTNTALKGLGDFQSPLRPSEGVAGVVGGGWGYAGRNVHWGVREHAMAAAANGIALHGGLRPFVATFFNFVDYLKPSLRLAALMDLPVIYVLTHDTICVGEDGPTHQPIEQLAGLRAIPNTVVLRPADASEVAEAWKVAIERTTGPTCLVLSRQKLGNFARTEANSASGVQRGGYVLLDAPDAKPDVVLVATGSEVELSATAAGLLSAQGVSARVVSLPSWEIFAAQPAAYRDAVLPAGVPRVGVEAASPMGWRQWVGLDGDVVAIDHFGASAPAEKLCEEFGFTPASVASRCLKLLGR